MNPNNMGIISNRTGKLDEPPPLAQHYQSVGLHHVPEFADLSLHGVVRSTIHGVAPMGRYTSGSDLDASRARVGPKWGRGWKGEGAYSSNKYVCTTKSLGTTRDVTWDASSFPRLASVFTDLAPRATEAYLSSRTLCCALPRGGKNNGDASCATDDSVYYTRNARPCVFR